ncbi:MAG: hypothetical protein ACYCY6_01985 [Minisyncoccota bacterium]
MNPWASRRKSIIFFIFFLSLIVVIGIPGYFLFQSKPDCFNNKQDGNESGVDCGGSCTLLCTPETLPLIERGNARILKIATSTYVTTILIENPNVSGVVERAPYTFSVFKGAERDPMAQFEGETYIGRGGTFALFEGPFALEEVSNYRAMFEWSEDLVWKKSEETTPVLSVDSINRTTSLDSLPRLEANIINDYDEDVFNIEVVALLSNSAGNTVAAGKTFVDVVRAHESVPVVFSWPTNFPEEPVSIRILPHVLPDKSYIR